MSGRNKSAEHQGSEDMTDRDYRISSERCFYEFCGRSEDTLLEPSTQCVVSPMSWRELRVHVHFENLGDGLDADFELRPEFIFAVKRRGHSRKGCDDSVEEGVRFWEQRRKGWCVSNRRDLHGLQHTPAPSPSPYNPPFFAS